MKTVVYFDAFNFYFGAIKGTPFKWVDLGKLCSLLLPNNQIIAIKYFTARVRPQPHDPDQPVRQQVYWRALRTLPNLTIYEGHFLIHTVSTKPAKPSLHSPALTKWMKPPGKAGRFWRKDGCSGDSNSTRSTNQGLSRNGGRRPNLYEQPFLHCA